MENPEKSPYGFSEMHRLFLLSSLILLIIILCFSPTCLSHGPCAPKELTCGEYTLVISFPFICGPPEYRISCKKDYFEIEIGQGMVYQVRRIDYKNRIITVVDRHLMEDGCPVPSSSLPRSSDFFKYPDDGSAPVPFYSCSTPIVDGDFKTIPCSTGPENYTYYYCTVPESDHFNRYENCQRSEVPLSKESLHSLELNQKNLRDVLKEGYALEWILKPETCGPCPHSDDYCEPSPNGTFSCFCRDQGKFFPCQIPGPISGPIPGRKRSKARIIIGVAAGGVGCLLLCILLVCYFRRRRFGPIGRTPLSGDKFLEPSSKLDLEKCDSKFYGTHVFSYEELEEATDNFDESKELGDGGFGTVYYGKLRDGRSVAVKRLYENNYKRVEQFMNEVEILSRLHHQNLVSLYGCTSRHIRELLLVYEFIPNGTVADHLHGDRAHAGSLTWPIRMSIATETAGALAYLHAVDPQIIHRDVKTNNILLDNNFHVKVADFGLSRLFPTDATHISTAPQGTPGYVDPDYYMCYQLTDKSDVYSFGVVLVELISSKPAVDITRHRNEINLACMAINKIHNQTLHELVDPELGFESDYGVRRMITLVAELAFRCLQEEKEVRPSMEEVVDILKGIETGEYRAKKAEEVDHPSNHVGLLKDNPPLSPDTVMDSWVSRSTTPNTNGC